MAKRDYYEVLGITKNASPDEIKKAFRKSAVEHHPDRGGDEAKFKELNEAYEVLKDPEKRKRYDQFGHAGVGSSAAGDGPGFNGYGSSGPGVNFDFGDLGLGDIFSNFFGGGGGFNTDNQRSQQKQGRDVETNVEITFEQAVFGTEVNLQLELSRPCRHCKGTTVEPGYSLNTCEQCKGSGHVVSVTRTIFGNIQQATVCPTCSGTGKVPEKICTVCNGKGTQTKLEKIELKIPAGIDDGAIIRLRERGEAIANGPSGDLFVNIRVKAHKQFTREGDLILSQEHIGMADAALGVDINVNTVDGPVRMKIPAGTQNGSDFKLSGHGVTHLKGGGRGAHIVTILVDTPTKLSKTQKELLEQFKQTSPRRFL
jgi:molecular chaperone DnaJ